MARRSPARVLLLIICALSFWPAALSPTRAYGQDPRHVLVIHSYNKELTWTDSEDEGIRSVLQARAADVEVHTEYLDTKLVSGGEHDRLFFELLKQKYASIAFQVVIATDDDAYNFYLKHHEALFPGVPVVFCGVNYFQDSQRAGRENLVTGVVEAFDIPETLRTALRLHPEAERVVVINDRTTTGLANKKIITEEVIPQFSEDVSFEFYEDLTMAELLESVRSVPPDDIILLMTFNKDRSGTVFSYDRSIDLVAKEAKAPIYGVWDFYLGKGIVGGMLTSGVDQGRIAAEMALRVLDGEEVRTIPVVRESPNRYKFDYQQMKRLDIKTSALPPGSLVINEPVSFYASNRILVWAVVVSFLGLTVTIVLLLMYIRQRRWGEEALRGSEEKYRSLVNNISIGVCRTAQSGGCIQANPAMAKMFGFDTPEHLMEASITDIYKNPDDRKRFFEELQVKGAVKDLEVAMIKKDGTPIWASLSSTVQYDEDGLIKWVDNVVEDITERRKAREDLQRAHEELEARVAKRTSELSVANEQLHAKNMETSVLYEVSSAIGQSLGMDELLSRVLNTISGIEGLKTDKSGIFLVEGDTMRMIANVGHSDHFVELHDDMHVGDCLCGIVAQTGEVIISANSSKDSRHTIVDCDAPPHGHIIVPLKTKDRVEGVLDLYTSADGVLADDAVALLLAIGNQLGVAIENAKLYEETKALSIHDSLTGLLNHEEILRILGQEQARAEREGSFVSVIMADLDHFKGINDKYGHTTGDAVLREVAARMLNVFRSYDSIGRYGGEEFVVVLYGCDGECTTGISERLLETIGDESIETAAGMIPITVSLGVAFSDKEHRRDVKSQIEAADRALYRAKANGRNRVEFASDDE